MIYHDISTINHTIIIVNLAVATSKATLRSPSEALPCLAEGFGGATVQELAIQRLASSGRSNDDGFLMGNS